MRQSFIDCGPRDVFPCPRVWAEESNRFACSAYQSVIMTGDIDEAYYALHIPTVEQRMIAAAARLAHVMFVLTKLDQPSVHALSYIRSLLPEWST